MAEGELTMCMNYAVEESRHLMPCLLGVSAVMWPTCQQRCILFQILLVVVQ